MPLPSSEHTTDWLGFTKTPLTTNSDQRTTCAPSLSLLGVIGLQYHSFSHDTRPTPLGLARANRCQNEHYTDHITGPRLYKLRARSRRVIMFSAMKRVGEYGSVDWVKIGLTGAYNAYLAYSILTNLLAPSDSSPSCYSTFKHSAS
jgi:hypothetical protein